MQIDKAQQSSTQPEAVRAGTAAADAQRPTVVVVGAGFGGLSVAKTLGNSDVNVLMIDRNNYHGFWPLLYQVATAGLEPTSIAYPVRGIVRKYANISFMMAHVQQIDFDHKQVIIDDGTAVPYQYLVLAAGSANNYFGNDALGKETYGMKDINEAERLRNHILTMFEQAVREPDPQRQAALLTFVVVGGGPTGVELAGAFTELMRQVLLKDYPTLRAEQIRVILIEATDKILLSFPEKLQRKALKRLQNMGVEVRLKTPIAAVENGVASFKDGSSVATETVVWAAGVRGALLADRIDVPKARGFRVPITPTLNIAERPEVYVIGDMAYLEGFKGNTAYPMVAPVAIQQGRLAANNILAARNGEQPESFKYFDKGQMATIGRKAAVLDSFGIRMSGYLAWLGWLFVHLIELVGFRNRLVVLTNWAYNYFTFDRTVRLITWTEQQPADKAEVVREEQHAEAAVR